MTDINDDAGPVEVWLTQNNIKVEGLIVSEDESTQPVGITSLSMRGAQREITGWMKTRGYEPAGRWQDADVSANSGGTETYRTFRKADPLT